MANVSSPHTYEDFMAFAKAQWESMMKAQEQSQLLGEAANADSIGQAVNPSLVLQTPVHSPSIRAGPHQDPGSPTSSIDTPTPKHSGGLRNPPPGNVVQPRQPMNPSSDTNYPRNSVNQPSGSDSAQPQKPKAVKTDRRFKPYRNRNEINRRMGLDPNGPNFRSEVRARRDFIKVYCVKRGHPLDKAFEQYDEVELIRSFRTISADMDKLYGPGIWTPELVRDVAHTLCMDTVRNRNSRKTDASKTREPKPPSESLKKGKKVASKRRKPDVVEDQQQVISDSEGENAEAKRRAPGTSHRALPIAPIDAGTDEIVPCTPYGTDLTDYPTSAMTDGYQSLSQLPSSPPSNVWSPLSVDFSTPQVSQEMPIQGLIKQKQIAPEAVCEKYRARVGTKKDIQWLAIDDDAGWRTLVTKFGSVGVTVKVCDESDFRSSGDEDEAATIPTPLPQNNAIAPIESAIMLPPHGRAKAKSHQDNTILEQEPPESQLELESQLEPESQLVQSDESSQSKPHLLLQSRLEYLPQCHLEYLPQSPHKIAAETTGTVTKSGRVVTKSMKAAEESQVQAEKREANQTNAIRANLKGLRKNFAT
ncbi:hypothetical protein DFP73DRAFT_598640 [Morchella snyderi]|nr:hypothetical protein DFP73DRAFT_598640 [Morchella snyderi]